MQRILIIGPCGAGKSTLAIKLGHKLGFPVFHMDQINWKPGWVESSKDEIRLRLNKLVSGERWVIDGNYGGTLEPRLARASSVVYLDYPISLCVVRLLKRIWTYHGRTRPDMTQGCPERFDWGFLIYVLQWRLGPGPRTEAHLRGYEDKVIRFKSPAALDRWMDSIERLP